MQALYDGESTGLAYPIETSRLRYFGGSTNHWHGLCAPLNDFDFSNRPWIEHSGWPITLDILLPYYRQAAQFLNLSGKNSFNFTTRQDYLPENEKLIVSEWRSPANLRLGEVYRKALAEADNVKILLNTNVVNIAANDQATEVMRLDVATLQSQRFTVKANHYILAAGGIENARLLLLSNKQMPAGLGNGKDLVGRFFMEHPEKIVGKLYTFGNCEILDPFAYHSEPILNVTPSPASMQKYKTLTGALLFQKGNAEPSPPPVMQYMGNILPNKTTGVVSYVLKLRMEQAPNPDSRVSLSPNRRDSLGLPVTRLHWALTEQDWRSFQTLGKLTAEVLSSAGVGVVKMDKWMRNYAPIDRMYWGYHHMGTTRMHDDPRYGVVDKDCRVHGISNLFIAGSSVFPTVGWANPTYTIIALSLRLSELIKRKT